MIGLDTNLLVGWLIANSETQVPEAPSYFIGVVVLAEFAWVMRTVFDNSKADLLKALTAIVDHPSFRFSDKGLIERVLVDFTNGPADFSDYLLLHDAIAQGASHVATRDKKAARHQSFQLVK